eukprot:239991_1
MALMQLFKNDIQQGYIEGYCRNIIAKLPPDTIVSLIVQFIGKTSWSVFEFKMDNKMQFMIYMEELWKSLAIYFEPSVMQYKYRDGSIPEIVVLDLKLDIVEKNMESKKIVSNACNGFEAINKTLGEYYQSQGNSTYYSEPTPQGKFLAYCEENGFEIEDINDELQLQSDAADCIYCGFDENFPFFETIKQSNCNQDEKIAEIYRVIKYCYQYNIPPPFCGALNLELNCNKNDIKIAETKYDLQVFQRSKIFKSSEVSLTELYAIGLKNDIPFIMYLVDSYQRDRMLCDGKRLTLAGWTEKSPFFTNICAKSKQKAEEIQVAMEIWMKRIAKRFDWKVRNKLQYDIEYMMQYFVGAGEFVEMLLEKGHTTPFAYDIVIINIARKPIVEKPIMIIPELSDSDSDSSDDEKDNDNDNNSYLWVINERLESNHCSYIRSSLPRDKKINDNFICKCLISSFNELKTQLKYKYGDDINQYPRQKRFCTVFDQQSDDRNKHSMFMFEPSDDCNTLPTQHVPEWYFNASDICIVPSKDYNNSDDTHSVDTLHSRAYRGQTLTLSFHVESLDCVRCYLFWNGFHIRVVDPTDLIIVLKSIFDVEYKHNKQYFNGNIIHDVSKLRVINDVVFDAFYKDVSFLPMQN